MISSYLKVRLGLTAALAAALLAAAVTDADAAVSPPSGAARLASGLTQPADDALDGRCTPPSDLAVCTTWHEAIRRNFGSREIGVLFGSATSYPEYATSYARLKSRYERLHDAFAAGNLRTDAASVK